jgi:hypothetical protein
MAERRLAAIAIALGVWCAEIPALADDTDAAHAAYDRGARAYDAHDYVRAAHELAKADEFAPNDVALELAIRAAVHCDDPVLVMALAAKAEGRNESLRLTAQEARSKMVGRTGRLTLACAPQTRCTGTVDGVDEVIGERRYVLVGEHRIGFDSEGRRELIFVRVAPDADLEVRATSPAAAPPARDASRGVSRTWFWIGLGVSAVLGTAATVSALDTRSIRDQYVASGSEDLRMEGADSQLRTNILAGTTLVALIGTAVLGTAFVRWSDP